MTATSHVYFLRDKAGNIKIGTSGDVAARVRQLQVGNSGMLELAGLMPGGRDLEQALHASWSDHRIGGEWFTPAPKILDFIEMHGAPDLANALTAQVKMPKKAVQQKRDAELGRRFCAFLREKHPIATAKAVAADTGCSLHAVEKWFERGSFPNGVAVLRLMYAYGPDFICAVVDDPPAWLDARRSAARQIELEAGIARQRAELAQLREANP